MDWKKKFEIDRARELRTDAWSWTMAQIVHRARAKELLHDQATRSGPLDRRVAE